MAVKKEGVTYDEIVRSVRAGNFAPVYYLMGEEAYYICLLYTSPSPRD